MTEQSPEIQIDPTLSTNIHKPVQTFSGVLHFHSETGTEGGHWALQDERFITKVPSKWGVFGDTTVYDTGNPDRKGITREEAAVLHGAKWDPIPDPVQNEPDFHQSSLFQGEAAGNKEADQRLMDKYEFRIKYAADQMDERVGVGNWHLEGTNTAVTSDGKRYLMGGTPRTIPSRPYGLKLGDITKNIVEWEDGEVEERLSPTLLEESWSYDGLHVLTDGDKLTIYDRLDPRQVVWEGDISLQQYSPFTESAFGLWIHADQRGIDRDTWARWF